MRRLLASLALLGSLAACSVAPNPALRQRDISDRGNLPKDHPLGVISAVPPGDTSFTPLRCLPNGPGYECSRSN